jgi:hypothetical protein
MRSHSTGLPASKQLLHNAIPAARKEGIQIIWLNWGLTQEDTDHAPPALKRTFARGPTDASGNVPRSSKTIYKGLGSELGEILLQDGEHIDGGSYNQQTYTHVNITN